MTESHKEYPDRADVRLYLFQPFSFPLILRKALNLRAVLISKNKVPVAIAQRSEMLALVACYVFPQQEKIVSDLS